MWPFDILSKREVEQKRKAAVLRERMDAEIRAMRANYARSRFASVPTSRASSEGIGGTDKKPGL